MNANWKLQTDSAGLAWLHFDLQDSAANLLSSQALAELRHRLDALLAEPPQGLVILSDKPGGFIAGADVKEFRQLRDLAGIEAHIQRVHALLARLEQAPFPTLALIHGFCLGGGLELALACDYRIARDDEGTRLGFPEVRLGIFPGYGGSVRSTALLGPLAALGLMLSGRTLSSRAARRIGLVDQVAPERQLRASARKLLQQRPAPKRPGWLHRLPGNALLRPLVAGLMRHQVRAKADPRHYPAPYALIDHWQRHGGDPQSMYAGEARTVAELLLGDTAQNLIRVFQLQERLKGLGKQSGWRPHRVHVVGAGAMGGDIAAWCALRGLQVTLEDRAPEFIGKALGRASILFQTKLKQPYLVQAAADRLVPDHRGLGAARADLVIEAVFEDLAVKRQLFADLERRTRPETLLATNTSTIPLERIAPGLTHPERLLGLHFFNPVAKMLLVELVRGEATGEQALARGATFIRRIDRLPLPVKSSPGFLVNRVLMPYLVRAVELVESGIPARVIDDAAKEFGMPMGPVELADSVGLDICLAAARVLSEPLGIPVPARLEQLVEQGRTGRKSGQGFYRYQKGHALRPRPPWGYRVPADLGERLIQPLLDEAATSLRQGIVEDADLLDAGLIFGAGFAPFTGGPMHYIEHGGRERLHRHQIGPGPEHHVGAG